MKWVKVMCLQKELAGQLRPSSLGLRPDSRRDQISYPSVLKYGEPQNHPINGGVVRWENHRTKWGIVHCHDPRDLYMSWHDPT